MQWAGHECHVVVAPEHEERPERIGAFVPLGRFEPFEKRAEHGLRVRLRRCLRALTWCWGDRFPKQHKNDRNFRQGSPQCE